MLAERLRRLYATPSPSLIEVLISSGSITAATDQIDLLDRVGQQDARVVGGLRRHKAKLAELWGALVADRGRASEAVAARQQEKGKIESLLARRRAVLDGASQELKTS